MGQRVHLKNIYNQLYLQNPTFNIYNFRLFEEKNKKLYLRRVKLEEEHYPEHDDLLTAVNSLIQRQKLKNWSQPG